MSFRAVARYAVVFLMIRAALLVWNGPIAEYDTISYLRGGLDWDIYHPPFTNIVLAICRAIWPSMWLPVFLQIIVNALAAAFLADTLFGKHTWPGMLAIFLTAIEPVSAFHTMTLLSEGWYIPVIAAILTILLRQNQCRNIPWWFLMVLVALAPWIRLQAMVEVGLMLAFFLLIRELWKMIAVSMLVLVCSAALLHMTYRLRFTVSPFDASVRSDHATAMIPDPLPADSWDFIYGYQEMFNACIAHDTHENEYARHRSCLDLLRALPRAPFPGGMLSRMHLNVRLAFRNPFLSEHQQHKLDMAVPDSYVRQIYGTNSWPFKSRALLPVPALLPWLTSIPWVLAMILFGRGIINRRHPFQISLLAWVSAIPVVVMVAFYYKERFLAAWHAVVILVVISGLWQIFQRRDEGKA